MATDYTGHFSWKTLFNVGLVVTVVAVAVLATVASGGAGAPLLVSAASSLAGTAVSAGTVTAAASAAAITGTAMMAHAVTASMSEASGNKGKDYQKAKNNKQANEWAEKVGYDDAEQLKNDYTFNQGTKFNMFKNKATGEIILISIKKATEIFTELFLP